MHTTESVQKTFVDKKDALDSIERWMIFKAAWIFCLNLLSTLKSEIKVRPPITGVGCFVANRLVAKSWPETVCGQLLLEKKNLLAKNALWPLFFHTCQHFFPSFFDLENVYFVYSSVLINVWSRHKQLLWPYSNSAGSITLQTVLVLLTTDYFLAKTKPSEVLLKFLCGYKSLTRKSTRVILCVGLPGFR